jgi:hypothetical protein
MTCFNQQYMDTYLQAILREGKLDEEIENIRNTMVGLTKYPIADKEAHYEIVVKFNQIFKALLASKMKSSTTKQ